MKKFKDAAEWQAFDQRLETKIAQQLKSEAEQEQTDRLLLGRMKQEFLSTAPTHILHDWLLEQGCDHRNIRIVICLFRLHEAGHD